MNGLYNLYREKPACLQGFARRRKERGLNQDLGGLIDLKEIKGVLILTGLLFLRLSAKSFKSHHLSASVAKGFGRRRPLCNEGGNPGAYILCAPLCLRVLVAIPSVYHAGNCPD